MSMRWQCLTTRGPKKPDAFCHIVWSYYWFFSYSFAPLIWFLLQSCQWSILWTKTPASQPCVVTSSMFLPSWSHSQDLTQDFPVTLDCSFQPPRQFYLSLFCSLFLFLYFFHSVVIINMWGTTGWDFIKSLSYELRRHGSFPINRRAVLISFFFL